MMSFLGQTVQFPYLDVRESADRCLQVPLECLTSLDAPLQAPVADRIRCVELRHRVE